MTQATKTKLLYVCTFGVAYIIAKKKAKLISDNKSNEIKKPTANIDVDNLVNILGGVNNIISIAATISSLKIVCKHPITIDQNLFKKMGAKGSVIAQNKITILFGDISYDICNQIKEKISLHNQENNI